MQKHKTKQTKGQADMHILYICKLGHSNSLTCATTQAYKHHIHVHTQKSMDTCEHTHVHTQESTPLQTIKDMQLSAQKIKSTQRYSTLKP